MYDKSNRTTWYWHVNSTFAQTHMATFPMPQFPSPPATLLLLKILTPGNAVIQPCLLDPQWGPTYFDLCRMAFVLLSYLKPSFFCHTSSSIISSPTSSLSTVKSHPFPTIFNLFPDSHFQPLTSIMQNKKITFITFSFHFHFRVSIFMSMFF